MKTTPKHTMPPGYHNALKAALHGIPDSHPVDRNTEKPRARPVVSLWRYAAVGVAAGERVLVEKDNFPGGVPVTMEAFDDAGFTSAVGAGEVLATKVAYAG